MKTLVQIVFLSVCLCATAGAQSIYKCKTPGGVMFSQKPCGEDAVKLSSKKSSGSTSATVRQSTRRQPTIDIEKFRRVGVSTAAEIIELIGPPAASYTHRGTEHWLYSNASKEINGQPVCPEILLENGESFQITWLPRETMLKAVVAANRFKGWERPGPVKDKPFVISDTDVQGENKTTVVRKFGQPDAKKVFNGHEWWEYEKVRLNSGDAQSYTLFLEFEGDTVASSAAN